MASAQCEISKKKFVVSWNLPSDSNRVWAHTGCGNPECMDLRDCVASQAFATFVKEKAKYYKQIEAKFRACKKLCPAVLGCSRLRIKAYAPQGFPEKWKKGKLSVKKADGLAKFMAMMARAYAKRK